MKLFKTLTAILSFIAMPALAHEGHHHAESLLEEVMHLFSAWNHAYGIVLPLLLLAVGIGIAVGLTKLRRSRKLAKQR